MAGSSSSSVWVRLDDQPYREFFIDELIDIKSIGFPTFDTIPNELPRDTRLRWRTEFMSLATRQQDWIQHMLASYFFAASDCRVKDPEKVGEEMVASLLRDTLSREADRFTANKWAHLFLTHVVHAQRFASHRRTIEVHLRFVLWSGSKQHDIHLTPQKP